jgi:single-stranded DNA-binding protein
MEKCFFHAEAIGVVDGPPQIIALRGGERVASLKLVIYTDVNGLNRERSTQYVQSHQILAFRNTADDLFKSVKNGDRIWVQGELQQRPWRDPQTGSLEHIYKVVLKNFINLTPESIHAWPEIPEQPELQQPVTSIPLVSAAVPTQKAHRVKKSKASKDEQLGLLL